MLRELEVVGGKAELLVAGVARRYGLSHAALNALAVIEGAGGPLPTGEVTARMHITTGTTTTVLDTLERKGLVQRIADPEDRRRVLVDVTPAAQEVLDRMLPEVQQLAPSVMRALDERALQQLLDSLGAIRWALDEGIDDLPEPKPRRRPGRLRRTES